MENHFTSESTDPIDTMRSKESLFRRWSFLVIVVLSIVLGVGSFLAYSLLAGNNDQIEQGSQNILEENEADEKADTSWNTYTNNLYGYQIKYPNEWSILGTGPTIYDPCVNDALNQQIVTITKANVTCENEKEFDGFGVVLIIGIEDTEWNEDEFRPPFFEAIEIEEIRGWTLGGEPCSLPTGCMKIIYFNHNGKGFGIMTTPVDGAADYDYSIIFDQILSTFRFIE